MRVRPAQARQQPAPAPAHRRPILISLMVTMALSAVDNTIVATAIPQVVRDLGGFSLFSWVFSAYLLTQTVTIPIYGKLADLWGRKPILITGTVVFLAGSALSAASWDMVTLICFRAMQGIGAGSIMATVNTLAGDLYKVEERGRVQGWLSSVWGISAVFGPTVGGSLAQYASWRWIFLINLPLGVGAITLIARYLREDVSRSRHRIDVAGAALVLVAAGALVFGLLQGGVAWPWLSPRSVAVFAVAALAGAAAVAAERRAAEPILPPWLWRRRALAGFSLASTGLGLLVLGAVAAGAVLATMSLGWPLASSQSARLFLRIGFRDTALIGAALCLAAVAVFAALPGPVGVWTAAADTFVLGAGLGLLSVCAVVGPQSMVGWGQRGVVTGNVMFCRYLGQSVGAAIFGAIFNTTLGERLRSAPAALRGSLPRSVSGIDSAIASSTSSSSPAGPSQAGSHGPGPAAQAYLRDAITAATHHVYLGLTVAALAAIAVLIGVIPRRPRAAAAGPPGAPGGPGAAGAGSQPSQAPASRDPF